jgi:hypothetical protein
MYYVHQYEVWLAYGGPEEGGWWYDCGEPVLSAVATFEDEEEAFKACRELNADERDRRERDEYHDYSSVLSSESTHYSYDVSDSPRAVSYPSERPYYQ